VPTKTEAVVGVNRAVIVVDVPAAIAPARGERLNGSSNDQLKETGTSPSLEMVKVLTAVSSSGQNPKSRFDGTLVDVDGMDARICTRKLPRSEVTSTQSSYSSSRMGRKWTCRRAR